jgi:pullulanase/glycogen debranching enzyme
MIKKVWAHLDEGWCQYNRILCHKWGYIPSNLIAPEGSTAAQKAQQTVTFITPVWAISHHLHND